MMCEIMKLHICLYCWLSLKGLDPQKFVIKENTATDMSVNVYANFLSQKQYKGSRARNHTEQRWGTRRENTSKPGEVYATDLTKKSRFWLVKQPEAVTLAKGSLIIINTARLFISPPCLLDPLHRPYSIPVFLFSKHHHTSDVVSFPNQSNKKIHSFPVLPPPFPP